jgi:hypothetical protein
MVTQESDSLFAVESKNGLKSYRFKTPKRISYDLAREPYELFPQGVFVERFRDSTEEVESTLRADYAIHHKRGKSSSLWEALGNVVATGEDGRTLYTEQLFWNAGTERIYSNVDCKVVQADGAYIGDGFESDQALKHWTFRNTVSRVAIDSPLGHSSSQGGTSQDGATVTDGSGGAAVPAGDTNDPERNGLRQGTPLINTQEQGSSGQRISGQNASEQNNTAARRERRPTIQPVEDGESVFRADSIR